MEESRVTRNHLVTAIVVLFLVPSFGCTWNFTNPWADEWDVQIVGDSVFDLSGDIRTVLKSLSGKGYKDRSVSGAKIAAIRNQQESADNRSSLKTFIADGGANDILQSSTDCDSDPLTNACLNLIDYVADVMNDMIVDIYYGPADSLAWLGYYHVKGSDAEKNEAIDYVHDVIYPDMFDLSGSGGTNFNGSVGSYGTYHGSQLGGFQIAVADPRSSIVNSDLKSDGIHPTSSGSTKLANLIWGVMVDRNYYR